MRTCLLLIFLTLLAVPTLTLAQDLINLPSAAGFSGSRFNQYINTVYAMFISIAALLAVVKIIIAGVKYMFSDVVTQKSDAKRDIRTALLGLLVVLAAVLILTVINPNLTSFDLNLTRPDPPDRPVSVVAAGDLAGVRVGDTVFDTTEQNCTQVRQSPCAIHNALDRPYLCVAASYDAANGRCTVIGSQTATLLGGLDLDNSVVATNQYDQLLAALRSAHGAGNVTEDDISAAMVGYTGSDPAAERDRLIAAARAACISDGKDATNVIQVVRPGFTNRIRVVCY